LFSWFVSADLAFIIIDWALFFSSRFKSDIPAPASSGGGTHIRQPAPQEFYNEIGYLIILRFNLYVGVYAQFLFFVHCDFLLLLRRIICTFFHNGDLLKRITYLPRGHQKAEMQNCFLQEGSKFVYVNHSNLIWIS